MKCPKVVFFDLDETLLLNSVDPKILLTDLYRDFLGDTNDDRFSRFMAELFAQANSMWARMHEVDQTGLSAMIECFGAAINSAGGDASLAATLFETFVERTSRATILSDNAINTLETLHAKGLHLGIITNGIEQMQRAKIEFHGLTAFVDDIIVSEKAGAHKPDTKIFNYALARTDHHSQQAWHVGDHPTNDIAGAIGAGLSAVFYDPSTHRRRIEFPSHAAQPDRVITNLIELTRSDFLPRSG